MKRVLVFLLVFCYFASACATVASTPLTATAPQPPVLATPTRIAVDLTAAQRAAVNQLAQAFSVPVSQVQVVSTEAVTWPNGCLGVQRLGVMCTQNEVRGFRIVLSARDRNYELHTNQDGSVLAPQQPLEVPDAAQKAAVTQLAANLGIPASMVKLVSTAIVEWPDSCLGVSQPGVACAQIVTPGYLFVLEAAGTQYEYHTDQNAGRIMPGSLALDWKQQGGIAGLCQGVTVYLSGEVYGLDCQGNGDGRTALLTSAQRKQLSAWVIKFGNVSIDRSDPQGVADGMTRTADLSGVGTAQLNAAEKQAIYDFGQGLYQSLYP